MEVDAEEMKRLREDRVLSQRELARKAKLALRTVWRLENGYSNAHPATVRKLAKALKVKPRELLAERRKGA